MTKDDEEESPSIDIMTLVEEGTLGQVGESILQVRGVTSKNSQPQAIGKATRFCKKTCASIYKRSDLDKKHCKK